MAAIAFPSIATSTKLPDGTTYSYVHVKPKGKKPYILFLHGFPEASFGWRHQIPYFSERGYGIIAPDLLGYGGTSKPSDLKAYKLKKMVGEVLQILDAVEVGQVIGVGHDWGSLFLARLHYYYPERFTKYAFLDVAYAAPRVPFSIDAVNEFSQKLIGYPIFGYWHFFNDPKAGEMMDEKVLLSPCIVWNCLANRPTQPDSLNALLFAQDPKFMSDHMSPIGAMRTYIEKGQTGPIGSWVTPEELETWHKIFDPSKGGCGPPLNWYKAQIANLNSQDEFAVPEERYHIEQPALLITCSYDYIAVPKMQVGGMEPFVKDLTVKEIASGHFVQSEKADEVNKTLEAFFEGGP